MSTHGHTDEEIKGSETLYVFLLKSMTTLVALESEMVGVDFLNFRKGRVAPSRKVHTLSIAKRKVHMHTWV